jgi:hypothetical protein
MSRDPMTDYDFLGEVCAWFRANGIEPKALPADPKASIANGQLTTLAKVQHNGRDVLNETRDGVLIETITVPLIVDPSADVAEWLRPRCPTCGR